MLKIICSEGVRNDRVRDYQRQMVSSNYEFIKAILDALFEARKIPERDTAKLSTILCSISHAYMHLASIDMNYIGEENSGLDMFAPLEYVIEMALAGLNK